MKYYKTKDEAVSAVASEKYPSPPARFENLATKGKPTGLTLAFIEWILTDGQQYPHSGRIRATHARNNKPNR